MLDHDDWQAIFKLFQRDRPDPVAVCKVTKADPIKNLVWAAEEFGTQAIPIFAFNYNVKYYDIRPNSATPVTSGQVAPIETVVKKVVTTVICPSVGDTILVLRQRSSRRLPRCIGVLQSTGFS